MKKNYLANQQSPYLLQHAENPVNWYPWGEEAFNKAKEENKPIFLSIGYSTCHWCHVMEEESFNDIEVATLLNDALICIKVDREERPDIDAIYMEAAHTMGQQGGWPLNLFLTSDKKPFLALTYIPKNEKYQRQGMMQLIPQVKNIWDKSPEKLLQAAEEITIRLNVVHKTVSESINDDISSNSFEALNNQFDPIYGGFGNQMKFPTTQNLLFLLSYIEETNDKHAIKIVELTLDQMRKGGIYDQIGYGFHRYATDPQWITPHFEKMLYDQAALLLTYGLAATSPALPPEKKAVYRQTVNDIFTYLSRDMTSPNGAFYAAEDADSEGEEGKFYLWHPDQLKSILGDNYKLIEKHYNLEIMVEHGKETGTCIMTLKSLLTPQQNNHLKPVINKLLTARNKRIHPFKDMKILCDWNGFTIAALAINGRILQDNNLLISAMRASKICLETFLDREKKKLHHLSLNTIAGKGKLDDYAYLCWGLVELFLATSTPKYLKDALLLAELLEERFIDSKTGTMFITEKGEKLIMRPTSEQDGPIPSGSSIAIHTFYKLALITGKTKLADIADLALGKLSTNINRYPTSFMMDISTILQHQQPHQQIIAIVGDNYKDADKELIKLRSQLPNSTMLIVKDKTNDKTISKLIPFTANMKSTPDKIAYFLCQKNRCESPVSSTEELNKLMQK